MGVKVALVGLSLPDRGRPPAEVGRGGLLADTGRDGPGLHASMTQGVTSAGRPLEKRLSRASGSWPSCKLQHALAQITVLLSSSGATPAATQQQPGVIHHKARQKRIGGCMIPQQQHEAAVQRVNIYLPVGKVLLSNNANTYLKLGPQEHRTKLGGMAAYFITKAVSRTQQSQLSGITQAAAASEAAAEAAGPGQSHCGAAPSLAVLTLMPQLHLEAQQRVLLQRTAVMAGSQLWQSPWDLAQQLQKDVQLHGCQLGSEQPLQRLQSFQP
ncbi:MAG: hypothetical protein FRX49_10505 [Trebouxia sp. A1-2]|nr:MAG: hypothetical protein FRX49_10505 [Trebouxia sp. A1-2]